MQKQLLHLEKKMTVWCDFMVTFIIDLYFIEKITANGVQTCCIIEQWYHDILRDKILYLQQHGCLEDIIFMQDTALSYIDCLVKQLLRQHFIDAQVISRHFPMALLPCLPDITPSDFWFCTFLKNNIYHNKTASV